MKIQKLYARMIYDSRGNPTTEVTLTTESGVFKSSCPSGASTGSTEAHELRDNEKSHNGKGVNKAINNINRIIAKNLFDKDISNQEEIDKFLIDLDGTPDKSNLGANAILPVSMAVCRATAKGKNIPLHKYLAQLSGNSEQYLPHPCFNILNGGEHAGNNICIQEFMICPVGADNFKHAMQMGSEIYANLKSILKKKYGLSATNIGDEGGFAPVINGKTPKDKIFQALDLIMEAIKASNYEGKVKIAMDAAATSFFKDGEYVLDYKTTSSTKMNSKEMIDLYNEMINKYPFVSLEDPLDENDWEGFQMATKELKMLIIGDDITTTNPERIKKAAESKTCNGLLLKLNQIGTVTEAIEAVRIAKENGWKIMTSHRSGETIDDFIADLSVGLGTEFIKSGAPCRGERLAKYNRLMEIEEEIGGKESLRKI